MMYLDLDELPDVFNKYWLWSCQRRNIASFDRSYYFGDKSSSLSEAIKDEVERQTGERPDGPVRLLTHMRYFGYIFNPVSFFYCFSKDGETLHSIVSEINNTPWNEKHCYVHRVDKTIAEHCFFEFEKTFHVSPFNSMNQSYDWRFNIPDDHIFIHMKVLSDQKKEFDATMRLEKKEISSVNLALSLIRFPFITLKIVFSIYYQALRLWLKRTPVYDHPDTSRHRQEASESTKKL